jgi:tetratricopeptide (TPR) repeat protein
MSADERIERARLLYERFVFGGEASVLAAADRELDAVEADLALARGRVMHGRFLAQRDNDPEQLTEDPRELVLFERATELYRALGDVPGEAESLFWVGCFHQVVRHDNAAAVPVLDRSCELAAGAGDKLTMSDALRHLGIAAHVAGRADQARERLAESTRIRREIGLMPGVAANLVGLAYIAAGQGRRAEAFALADEAAAIAEASGAHAIARQAGEVREHIAAGGPLPAP